jgi:hypothetical protein
MKRNTSFKIPLLVSQIVNEVILNIWKEMSQKKSYLTFWESFVWIDLFEHIKITYNNFHKFLTYLHKLFNMTYVNSSQYI